jgi:hypothetical protein
MNKYREIDDRVKAAIERAREDKGVKTDEEIKADFFKDMTELFNEEIAGDVTLADGRTVTIPEI